jgi:hypothetical protein
MLCVQLDASRSPEGLHLSERLRAAAFAIHDAAVTSAALLRM